MKLNHLNLTVINSVETQEFLARYFGLKPRGKANKNMAFLSDDNGTVLSLMCMNFQSSVSQLNCPLLDDAAIS